MSASTSLANLVAERQADHEELCRQDCREIRHGSTSGAIGARQGADRSHQALRALFDGSRFRESETHCEKVRTLFAAKPSAWGAFCSELLEIYRGKLLAGGPTEPDAEGAERLRTALVGEGGTTTQQQLARVYANLSDQTLGEFAPGLRPVTGSLLPTSARDSASHSSKLPRASKPQLSSVSCCVSRRAL